MVNFGKTFGIYITADDDFCFLFIKKFIRLSNFSNVFRTSCGSLRTCKTCMLESLELRCMSLIIISCSLNSDALYLSH
jgi:hypothetical protein